MKERAINKPGSKRVLNQVSSSGHLDGLPIRDSYAGSNWNPGINFIAYFSSQLGLDYVSYILIRDHLLLVWDMLFRSSSVERE